MLLKNEKVEVSIILEPNNQYGGKAMCLVNGEWHRIGYVVREALDHLYQALSDREQKSRLTGKVSCRVEQVWTWCLCRSEYYKEWTMVSRCCKM